MRKDDYRLLSDVVEHQAQALCDRVAMVYGTKTTTYRELDQQANCLAGFLLNIGVGRGDRIAILSRNSDRFFVCLFAVSKIGAVLSPINWRLTKSEVEYILKYSEAKLLFCEQEFINQAYLESGANLSIRKIVLLNGSSATDDCLDTILSGSDTRHMLDVRDPEDAILQMYTSGTTGFPKGAMISHRSLAKYCSLGDKPTPEWYRTSSTDIVILLAPTFHTGGIEVALRVFCAGAKLIIHNSVDLEKIIDDVEGYQATAFGIVPASLQMLINHPRAVGANFSSLKTVFYGGSPMPREILAAAIDRLGCDFVGLYGMTEAQSAISALAPEDHKVDDIYKMQSVGRALPGVELRVVGPNGVDLETNCDGEIWIRSNSLMSGYWQMAVATETVLSPDGWFKSGDVGRLDDFGYLFVKDRLKDMIISGGENIYSAEVEAAILSFPGIKEAAVIGVPDKKWGEAVMAIIVADPQTEIITTSLVSWIRERLASYKVPKHMRFASQLPRNASGKVLKPELRSLYGKDLASSESARTTAV